MPSDGRVTIPYESQPSPRGDSTYRERRLLALAERQHGVVALDQLREQGLSAPGVRRRVARGRLHRVHRGVYALGRADLTAEGRWMAGVLACGEGALLSHWSAGTLHELLRGGGARIDVTIARRRSVSRPGLGVHRTRCLDDADRGVVRGIPCTSVPRTLLDLAQVASPRTLERACDQAEVLRVLDMTAVGDLLARREGHPGARRLRAALGSRSVGANVPRNELEDRLLQLCHGADLPPPEVNVWINLAGTEMQVDFLWRRQRVIVEVDGFATHRTRQAFQRDRRRDQLLTLAGWRVIRFTWDEVTKEPTHVIDVMRKLVSVAA